jgi:hypothetical protein
VNQSDSGWRSFVFGVCVATVAGVVLLVLEFFVFQPTADRLGGRGSASQEPDRLPERAPTAIGAPSPTVVRATATRRAPSIAEGTAASGSRSNQSRGGQGSVPNPRVFASCEVHEGAPGEDSPSLVADVTIKEEGGCGFTFDRYETCVTQRMLRDRYPYNSPLGVLNFFHAPEYQDTVVYQKTYLLPQPILVPSNGTVRATILERDEVRQVMSHSLVVAGDLRLTHKFIGKTQRGGYFQVQVAP